MADPTQKKAEYEAIVEQFREVIQNDQAGVRLDTLRVLIKEHSRIITNKYSTLLHDAAACGNVGAIDVLIENGADIEGKNAYNQNALQYACASAMPDAAHGAPTRAIERLLEIAKEKNVLPYVLKNKDKGGNNALHNLTWGASEDFLGEILGGTHPKGRDEAAKLLLDAAKMAGFKDYVDRVNDNGNSALAHACYFADKATAQVLLDAGAKNEANKQTGELPLDMLKARKADPKDLIGPALVNDFVSFFEATLAKREQQKPGEKTSMIMPASIESAALALRDSVRSGYGDDAHLLKRPVRATDIGKA